MTKKIAFLTLLAFVFSCRDELSEIKVDHTSKNAQFAAGTCAIITLTNKLQTNKVKKPSESYRNVDVVAFDFSYQITANEGADPKYFDVILGNDSFQVEEIDYVDKCVGWDSDGDCNDYDEEKKYIDVLAYGSSRIIQTFFTNLLNLSTQIPSGASYEIYNIWAETSDGAKVFNNLNYVSSEKLDCYKSHILTLYNARLAPSSAGRVADGGEDSVGVSVISTSLFTAAEQGEFAIAGEKRREELGEIASVRATELKTYLIETLQENSYVDYMMAKAKATLKANSNNTTIGQQQVLEAFPEAQKILGDEISRNFAKSVVEAMEFQNSL